MKISKQFITMTVSQSKSQSEAIQVNYIQFEAATSLSIYTLITLVVLKAVREKPKISISKLKHSFEILVKVLPPDRKLLTYSSILYEQTHKDVFILT